MYMDNTISNQNRNITGVGKGGSVSDDMKFRLNPGSEIERNKQKHNKNFQSPPTLPHEINSIIPRLGDIFSSILEIKMMFQNVKNNPAVKSSQYKLIEEILENLDSINMTVADISTKLDDLALND
jgi:hypothetical protein